MAGYVLHFPKEPIDPQLLERTGLAALAVDGPPEWWQGRGQEGIGAMCGWNLGADDGPAPGEVERTWLPLPATGQRQEGQVWLGVETQRPPIPKNIAHKKFVPGGQFVPLADGHAWHVPVAARLPRRGVFDGTVWHRVVTLRYEAFYACSAEYFDRLLAAVDTTVVNRKQGGPPADITFDEGYAFVAQALGFNYRVTPEILSALDVLDDQAILRAISVVICQDDISSWAFEAKKKDSVTGAVC